MMVKKQRIPASEIKGVRTFGAGCDLVIRSGKHRLVPDGEIQNLRSFGYDVQAAGVVITEGPWRGKAKK